MNDLTFLLTCKPFPTPVIEVIKEPFVPKINRVKNGLKKCRSCGEIKSVELFGQNGDFNGKKRYKPECKECSGALPSMWIPKKQGSPNKGRMAA